MLIHRASMPAEHQMLIQYLRNKFPECTIHLIYEAGFRGFNLFDRLTEEGIDCIVIPPHLVTEPKVNRVKTDKRDANRLAVMLENGDFKEPCFVPDRERREDRQISRTLWGMQKDIIRTRNRIRKFLDFNGIEVPFPERWGKAEFEALKDLPLGDSLKTSLLALYYSPGAALGAQGIVAGGLTRPVLQGTIQEGLSHCDKSAGYRMVHRDQTGA
jgi:transposase